MKNIILTLSLIIIFFSLNAQETKLITKKKKGRIIEKYSVLKSDKDVKHGEYIHYHFFNDNDYRYIKSLNRVEKYSVKEKGYYKFGLKNSTWYLYNYPSINIRIPGSTSKYSRIELLSKGNYSNGKKVGVWETYFDNIIKRYDYDLNKELPIITTIQPKYPKRARELEIEGYVIVSYKLDDNCNILNIEIEKGLYKDCDLEAIRVLKKTLYILKKEGECDKKEGSMRVDFILL